MDQGFLAEHEETFKQSREDMELWTSEMDRDLVKALDGHNLPSDPIKDHETFNDVDDFVSFEEKLKL